MLRNLDIINLQRIPFSRIVSADSSYISADRLTTPGTKFNFFFNTKFQNFQYCS